MELELTGTESNDPTLASRMNHTIIHIGAGEGQDIERQLSSKPKRLILVEPNPIIAARLRKKTRAWSNVEVLEIAVVASGSEDQLATLHEYNWNTASSLQEAAQLEQLFPGLQLIQNHQVKALSAAALIERLDLKREEELTLIIEAPASEKEIVEALCESNQVGLFSTITLTCPGTDLYVDGSAPTDLLTWLMSNGFETVEQDLSDPDWPVFVVKQNHWHYELLQAETRQKALEIRLNELLEEKNTLERALAVRSDELNEKAKLVTEHEAQLEQSILERDAQAKLATERHAELEILKTDNAVQYSRSKELEAKLDQLTAAHNEQTRLVAERQRRVSELESQLVDMEQRQALMAEEMHRAEGQIDLITDTLLREPGL